MLKKVALTLEVQTIILKIAFFGEYPSNMRYGLSMKRYSPRYIVLITFMCINNTDTAN